ncbi:MAG TPA: DNA circularization N-terminal domain-containing protein [Xanthobacteraceae bacterium]|jgi:prophage DNA circulation protein
MDIRDLHNPWRDALRPASFRNAHFHCEVGRRENGRRVVVHEFPKKSAPYAEDMGRRAKTFTVRAYCIQYPTNLGQIQIAGVGTIGLPGFELFLKDYRIARDLLIAALESYGAGNLQLPSLPAESVLVTRYSLTEEQKFGGYCTFDIEFAEAGFPPQYFSTNTPQTVNSAASTVQQNAANSIDQIPL